MAETGDTQGWGTYHNTRKWHYWHEGDRISMCGKWTSIILPPLSDFAHDHVDNCATCKRKRLKKIDKEVING